MQDLTATTTYIRDYDDSPAATLEVGWHQPQRLISELGPAARHGTVAAINLNQLSRVLRRPRQGAV